MTFHYEFTNPVDLKPIFDTCKRVLNWSYTFYWDNGQYHFTLTLWEVVIGCLVVFTFFKIFNAIYDVK